MSERRDRHDGGRRLRDAADAAAAHYEKRDDAAAPVGTPGWWDARQSRWGDVRFLDAVEDEYGRAVRWAVVVVRELVLLAVLFWCVAFVMGFTVDGDSVGLLGVTFGVVTGALVVAVGIRLLLAGVGLVVRRARSARLGS